MPTRLWDILDYLPGMFRDALTSDAVVLEGPQARKTTPPDRYVIVGTDGGETGLADLPDETQIQQSWSDLGTTGRRDEAGEIPCAAWAWSGSTDVSLLRAMVKADVADIEKGLIADRSLGGLLTATPGGFGVELARLSIWQSQFMTGDGSLGNGLGTFVRASFVVAWQCRVAPT